MRVRMGLHSGETELGRRQPRRPGHQPGIAHRRRWPMAARSWSPRSTRALVGTALPDGRHVARPRRAPAAGPRDARAAVAGDIDGLPVGLPAPPVRRRARRQPADAPDDRSWVATRSWPRCWSLLGGRPAADAHRARAARARPACRWRSAPGARTGTPTASTSCPSSPSPSRASCRRPSPERLDLPDRGGARPIDRLREHLRDRRLLIILDNFEQVIEAAPLVARAARRRARAGHPGHQPGGAAGLWRAGVPGAAAGRARPAARPRRQPRRRSSGPCALFLERARAVDAQLRPDRRQPRRRGRDLLPAGRPAAGHRARRRAHQAPVARRPCSAASSTGCRSWAAAHGTCRPASRRFVAPSAGATTCWTPADRDLFACFSVFAGAHGPGVGGGGLRRRPAWTSSRPLVARGQEPRPASRHRRRRDALPDAGDHPRVRRGAARRGRPDRRDARAACRALPRRGSQASAASCGRRRPGRRSTAWRRTTTTCGRPSRGPSRAGDAPTALGLTAGLWRFWQKRGYIAEGMERLDAALALPGCDDERAPAAGARGGRRAGLLEQRPGPRPAALRGGARDPARARATRPASPRRCTTCRSRTCSTRTARPASELVREAIELYEAAGDEVGLARVRWGLANIEYAKGRGGRRGGVRPRVAGARDLRGGRRHVHDRLGDLHRGARRVPDGPTGRGTGAGSWPRCGCSRRPSTSRATRSCSTPSRGSRCCEGDPIAAARIAGAVDTLERTTGTGLNRTNRSFFDYDPEPLRTGQRPRQRCRRAAAWTRRTALDYASEAGGRPHLRTMLPWDDTSCRRRPPASIARWMPARAAVVTRRSPPDRPSDGTDCRRRRTWAIVGSMEPIAVTIWNEYVHERTDAHVRAIYPAGIHGAIAARHRAARVVRCPDRDPRRAGARPDPRGPGRRRTCCSGGATSPMTR